MNKEEEIKKASIDFIQKHRELLINKFLPEGIEKNDSPGTIFMAGSPGAGKTEYSKRFIKELGYPILRIDADDIREIIPGYNGENSHLFHAAASRGVDKLYDYGIKKKLNMVVDVTLASYEVAYRNIERAINKNRKIAIKYIYQDPKISWLFTKYREVEDRRKIDVICF